MGMFDAPGGWQQSLLAGARNRQMANDNTAAQADPFYFLRKGPETVLRDPNWEAYFEAMDRAGVDNLGDESVGQKKGMFPRTNVPTTTMFAPGQESAITPSNQINAPLQGLIKASGGTVNDPRDLKRR